MNGKSVEVDNTDAEGRLILSGIILSQSLILLEYWWIYICRRYLLYIYHLQTTYFGWSGYSYGVRATAVYLTIGLAY